MSGIIPDYINGVSCRNFISWSKVWLNIFKWQIIHTLQDRNHKTAFTNHCFTASRPKDRNGVIENLGLENTVQISKDAAISKANAEREIAVARAEASRAANEAQVAADTEIAKKQNEHHYDP